MVFAVGIGVGVGVGVNRDLGSVRRQYLLDGQVLDLREGLATLSAVQFQLEEATLNPHRDALSHQAVPVSRLESDAHWETAQCPLLALSGHLSRL